MSEIYIEKDIYDNHGVLLLVKGSKATEAIVEKLKKHGYIKPEAEVNSGYSQHHVSYEIGMKLKEQAGIRNERVFGYASSILGEIINDVKTKPYGIFMGALCGYVDWVYSHSIDVALISLMIAIEIGCEKEELWNIGLGTLLHDVGKLLIPKTIIQKPGVLDEMETAFMRQHCELGLHSIAPYGLPEECTNIILQHHERLDGSGYPQRLREEEISRNAKIAMIADVVDAVTSDRPYRPREGINEAIMILKNEEEKYAQELVTVLQKLLLVGINI